MKVLLILIILFILSVYSNTILYGGEYCSTEIQTKFQNSKTKFIILQNKIKEIESIYNNLKKNLHNKLKQFHLISNQNNLNNTLDGYKTDLKNEVLNLNSINLNLYGGQFSSICKLKTKIIVSYNVLDNSLSIFLKTKINKYRKQSLIDIENWYNDIKNNLLTSNFEKTNDYDDKIIILDKKYSYTNKINIQYLNNLNQITKNNNNLITDIKINTNPFKEDDVFTSLNTSSDIKLHVVNFKELLTNSNLNFLPIINSNAFHFNFGLYNMNTDKPYIETDFDLSKLKKFNIIDKNNNIYQINIYNEEYKYYIDINNIYKVNYFTTQIKIKNYLDTLNKKKIINDYYITPLKNDLKYINYNGNYIDSGLKIIQMLCAGIIYTDFISKIPHNKSIYDKNFFIYNTYIGPYIPRFCSDFQKIHYEINNTRSIILNNQKYDFDKFFNYFNHPKYSDKSDINYYLRNLYETPTTIIDRFDNTKEKSSNKLRDYIKTYSAYFNQLCTDDKYNPNDKIIHLRNFFNNKITTINKSLKQGFFDVNTVNTSDQEYNDSFYNLIKNNIEKIIILKECIKPFKKIKETLIYEGPDDEHLPKFEHIIMCYHKFNILFYQTKVFHNIYKSKEGFNLRENGALGSGSFKLHAEQRSVYDKLKIENILVDHYVGWGGTRRGKDSLYKRTRSFEWLQYFIYRYFEAFSHSILPLSTANFFTNMNNNESFDLQFKEERNGFYYPTNIGTSYIPRPKYYVSNSNYYDYLNKNANIDIKYDKPDTDTYPNTTYGKNRISKYVPYDWIRGHGTSTYGTYNYMHHSLWVNIYRELGLKDRDELIKSITGPAYMIYNKINGNNITLFKDNLVNENINILENEFILGIKKQSNFHIYNDFYFKNLRLVFEDDTTRYIYYIVNYYKSTNQSYKFYMKIKYIDYENKSKTEPTNTYNNPSYIYYGGLLNSIIKNKLYIQKNNSVHEIKTVPFIIVPINYMSFTKEQWIYSISKYSGDYNEIGHYIENKHDNINLTTDLDTKILIFQDNIEETTIYLPKDCLFNSQTYDPNVGNFRNQRINLEDFVAKGYTSSTQKYYILLHTGTKKIKVYIKIMDKSNIYYINIDEKKNIRYVSDHNSCTHLGVRELIT